MQTGGMNGYMFIVVDYSIRVVCDVSIRTGINIFVRFVVPIIV